MNISKSKSKVPGKFERQYVVRLSLEDCRGRLEKRGEEIRQQTLHENRIIQVDLWSVDRDTLQLRVYKIPPLTGWPYFGLPTTRAYGTLNRQADGTTMVMLDANTSRWGYIKFWSFWLFVWASSTVFFLPNAFTGRTHLTLLTSALLLTGIGLYTHRYFPHEHRELLFVVETALGRVKGQRRRRLRI